MRVKSARSIRKGASSGQTAASLVENHARKPPSSALIANHASKPALFEVPISESQVNLLKWVCLFMQAVCTLVATAIVHSDNRLASIIAMGIFATGIAASILLILAHDRPFTGEIAIKPDPLLQVMPEIASSR